MTSTVVRMLNVLLVDDSEDDVVLALEALKTTPGLQVTHVAKDGMEAISYLRGLTFEGDRPDLILLDLNMPKLDGFQTLLVLQGDESLRGIPVVVLSASDWEDDVRRAYNCGAATYIRKPKGFTDFISVIHRLEDYWVRTARLPHGP